MGGRRLDPAHRPIGTVPGRRADQCAEVGEHVAVRDVRGERALDRVLHVGGRHFAIDRAGEQRIPLRICTLTVRPSSDTRLRRGEVGPRGGRIVGAVGVEPALERVEHPERVAGVRAAGIERVDVAGGEDRDDPAVASRAGIARRSSAVVPCVARTAVCGRWSALVAAFRAAAATAHRCQGHRGERWSRARRSQDTGQHMPTLDPPVSRSNAANRPRCRGANRLHTRVAVLPPLPTGVPARHGEGGVHLPAPTAGAAGASATGVERR